MDAKERHCPPVDGHEDSISFGAANSMASSYLQSSLHQPLSSLAMPNSAVLPRPIAMSLRVRESDSISLKHIFEQRMMGSAAAKSEQECSRSSPPGQQMGGSQVLKNPDRRKLDISQLDLSFRKTQASTFANSPAGFGSPISAPAPANQEPEPVNTLCMQQDYRPHERVSCSKPTAQMTIFYSGTVNVFADVPAEEARAIMVLARNCCSSNPRCLAPSTAVVASAPSGCTEMMVKEGGPSPLKAPPTQPETTSSMSLVNTNGAGIVKNASSTSAISAQKLLSIASPPPAPAPSTCPESSQTTQAAALPAKRSGGLELPHARKASLARFLEKRKDRAVQVQQFGADQQDPIEEKGEEGAGEKAQGNGNGNGNGKPRHDPSARSPSSTWQTTNSSSSSRDNVGSAKRTKPDVEDDEGSSSRKRSLNEHRFFL